MFVIAKYYKSDRVLPLLHLYVVFGEALAVVVVQSYLDVERDGFVVVIQVVSRCGFVEIVAYQ